MNSAVNSELQSDLRTRVVRLQEKLSNVIRGKTDVIEKVSLALLCGGSVLLEDVPGVGKTTLVKSLAALTELDFQRVQCTPDLLPADVLGFSIFNPQNGTFTFRHGPVFCNVLLLDEINRASPRTQSALLEVMAERQVTVEGNRYEIAAPFFVLATQNPAGYQGTFPLPESQLDRFLFRISMDYPDFESEVDLALDGPAAESSATLTAELSSDALLAIQDEVRTIRVDRLVAEYIVKLVRATRSHADVELGCSPRGTQMLIRAAQASAWLQGRDFVLPDDAQAVAPLVLEHRLVTPSGDARAIVRAILDSTDVPL